MTEIVVDAALTETLAELSRRPTREQHAIVVEENEELRRQLAEIEQDLGSFW